MGHVVIIYTKLFTDLQQDKIISFLFQTMQNSNI